MKKIVYTRSDGGLSIVHPYLSIDDIPFALALLREEEVEIVLPIVNGQIDDFLLIEKLKEYQRVQDFMVNRAHIKSIPSDASDIKIIDEEKIPKDRTFRSAFEQSGENIVINMEKAKTIHFERLKEACRNEIEKDENEFILNEGEISEKRTLLRQSILSLYAQPMSTPEELKGLWPESIEKPIIYLKENNNG
jgi:hypothetical protein